MPRKSQNTPTDLPTPIRRSARLHKPPVQPIIKPTVLMAQIDEPKSKKRKTTNLDHPDFLLACKEEGLGATSEVPMPLTSSLQPITRSSQDLRQREKALLKRELEMQRKSELLDLQLSNVSKKEQKASDMIEKCEIKAAEATLALLDEHFTCSLCYETMACPYVLHPLKCGHTFDAICILRWFFSKAHQACGGWHEYVACPICRSQLIITPERLPRHELTFPFIPNRTVDAALKDLIGKLEHTGSSLKREASGRVKVKREEGDVVSVLEGWRSGGSTRREWIKREKMGREEMAFLTTNWTKLGGQDFIVMKARLQV